MSEGIRENERARILEEVGRAWEKACSFCGLGSLPCPEVDFSLRGRAAGQARIETAGWQLFRLQGVRMRIRLNVAAYRLAPAEFLERTIPHEVAHLVTWLQFGGRKAPHGREWRAVMEQCFGLTAERTHRLDLSPARRTKATYRYRCQCREHWLTAIRHGRVLRGHARYRCRQCGGLLEHQNGVTD